MVVVDIRERIAGRRREGFRYKVGYQLSFTKFGVDSHCCLRILTRIAVWKNDIEEQWTMNNQTVSSPSLYLSQNPPSRFSGG